MRKHISKAIARRSGAIQTALEQYNTLAPIQVPPRPTLDYMEVIRYASLGEFALLKYSRRDILAKPWAVPENREMAAKFFKVLRSHEELTHLNIETSRLSAWVDFEEKEILSAYDTLNAHRLNNVHRAHLHCTSQLSGYTGPPLFALLEREETDDEGDDEDEDEGSNELLDEASRLEDTISHIVLQ
ncbi:hypothetical protein EV702DRAFT_1179145 [Suillus placidus]|uniref:Uncharacterized protein n=1 Tax=Suillus placidus TaxID=48579 RepID=A0A9P7D3L9_9AGAM|nr:hypothetical protein EV702DRAFT_1179145 [Suillus placidus]